MIPGALTVDGEGTLYVSDPVNLAVRKITGLAAAGDGEGTGHA